VGNNLIQGKKRQKMDSDVYGKSTTQPEKTLDEKWCRERVRESKENLSPGKNLEK